MYARMSAFLLALVLAVSAVAAAQETTSGTITGKVMDAKQLPVPGVTVTVTGPQGAQTLVTDGEGRYFAPFLVPGTYVVRAELQGFKTTEQPNVLVNLGSRREVDLELQIGGITETVVVNVETQTVDTASTTVGFVLESEQLSRLPVGRSLPEFLYLVPGVTVSANINSVGSVANPSISGASGLENGYVIDGVNITDTGFGGFGAYNSNHGSLGVGVTADFIKETEVKTGGFEAEYGQTSGGVVNVITKSGGNKFSGSVFGYTRSAGLEAGWKHLQVPNGAVNTTGVNNADVGVSLGGKIVPDRLFYFATYNPQWQSRTFIAPEAFPYESLGDVDRNRAIQAYAGKISANVDKNANHRLDFSFFGDPSAGESGLQRYTTLRRISYAGVPGTTDISGGYSELDYGSNQQTGRYNGVFGGRWLVEASISNSANKFIEIPTSDTWRYRDFTQTPNGETGGLGDLERNEGTNLQYGAKSTHIVNGAGTHQIRYGVQIEQIEFTRDVDYSGPNLVLSNGQTTVTGGPIEVRTAGGVTYYRATRGKLLPVYATPQDYTSFFIQDTWQAGRLTIRPGLRYERQYMEGYDPGGRDTSSGFVDAPDLCYTGDTQPGEGSGNGDPMACRFTWNNWAPRIGATFDLTGDGKAKVFASWGDFYGKIPNDLAVRSMSADAGITRQDYYDAALTQPIPNGVNYAGTTSHLRLAGLHAALIDPDSGSTFKREFVTGVEFDILPHTNLGFRYIRRTTPQIVEDIGTLPFAAYLAPGSEDVSVEYFITNVDVNSPVANCCGLTPAAFEDVQNTYNAFEVTLNKRFSGNWSAIASYRFSQLEGNFEGFFRSDNGQSDPAISSLFDFPTNDPSFTETYGVLHTNPGDIRYQGCALGCGVLPNDRPHQVKLYGNYLWGNFNGGAGLNVGSGKSLSALAGNLLYANAGEIPYDVRGSGIESVSHGFVSRSPTEFTLDLHADYALNFGGRRVLLLADVFNLFNRRVALDYDFFTERSAGIVNPNYGQDLNGGNSSNPSYQAPLSVRFGARFDW
jgi:hypothetical protein